MKKVFFTVEKRILNKKLILKSVIGKHLLAFMGEIAIIVAVCWFMYEVGLKNPVNTSGKFEISPFAGLVVIGTVYLIVDSAFRFRNIIKIQNGDFFVLKSVITEKEKDGDLHYFVFHNIYNCKKESIVQNVSSEAYFWYNKGNCFYLVFFGKDDKNYSNVRYMYPCDKYDIDEELMTNYADCSKGHNFKNDDDFYEKENYSETSYKKYNDDLETKGREKSPGGKQTLEVLLTILNKVIGILLGFISFVVILNDTKELIAESPMVFTTFALASFVSLLIVFTKLKMLILLYITAFFAGIAVESVFIDKEYVLGMIFAVTAIIPAICVLHTNIKRKKY